VEGPSGVWEGGVVDVTVASGEIENGIGGVWTEGCDR
jgi:hypothetical protein